MGEPGENMDEVRTGGPRPAWWSRPEGASGTGPAGRAPRPSATAGGAAAPPRRPVGPLLPSQAAPGAAAPLPASGPARGAVPACVRYDPWAPPPELRPAPLGPPHRTRSTAATLSLLLALTAGAAGGAVGAHLERSGGFGAVDLPQPPAAAPHRAPDSITGIAERALPSVVTVHVRGAEEGGTGTGFVLDERGHLLTNHHVVEPAADGGDITVAFDGGGAAPAEVVGTDSGYDLAVLKVDARPGLRPLPLGNSDSVRVGDPVVAIGSPYDLAGTVTAGIISATGRPITAGGGDGGDVSYVEALQTDAPINPGNSGGPLLDARGLVIGVNSAIRAADGGPSATGNGGSIGLGFAIPVNQAARVAEELINEGRATHPVMGVTLDMEYSGDGARVADPSRGRTAVTPGGPADAAGIEEGDVITGVDGDRVHSGEELVVEIRSRRPGERLRLTFERDGEELSATVVLGSASGP